MKARNILQSISDKLNAGSINMRTAREELYFAGWFNYLPSEEQVENLLNRFAK